MDLDLDELEATRKKNGDKTLEDLGFELLATEEDFLEYFKSPEKTNGFGKTIYFFTDIKKVQIHGTFTSLELKAINKKVEELGW